MSRDRGQTTLDFAVGMSVFLGVVAFAFGFVPTIFAPFDTDTGASSVVADRTADRLTADLLVESPGEPSVLNGTCTRGFFEESDPGGCRYDTTNLHDALGIDSTVRVNVTVQNGSGDIRRFDGTRLARGGTPVATDDTVVARRVVLLPGRTEAGFDRERNQFIVRVW